MQLEIPQDQAPISQAGSSVDQKPPVVWKKSLTSVPKIVILSQ
jgi:hypothetical protein